MHGHLIMARDRFMRKRMEAIFSRRPPEGAPTLLPGHYYTPRGNAAVAIGRACDQLVNLPEEDRAVIVELWRGRFELATRGVAFDRETGGEPVVTTKPPTSLFKSR